MNEVPLSIAALHVLWWRPNFRSRWRMIATGQTQAELTQRAADLPSGDVYTGRQGDDPNKQRRAFLCN